MLFGNDVDCDNGVRSQEPAGNHKPYVNINQKIKMKSKKNTSSIEREQREIRGCK